MRRRVEHWPGAVFHLARGQVPRTLSCIKKVSFGGYYTWRCTAASRRLFRGVVRLLEMSESWWYHARSTCGGYLLTLRGQLRTLLRSRRRHAFTRRGVRPMVRYLKHDFPRRRLKYKRVRARVAGGAPINTFLPPQTPLRLRPSMPLVRSLLWAILGPPASGSEIYRVSFEEWPATGFVRVEAVYFLPHQCRLARDRTQTRSGPYLKYRMYPSNETTSPPDADLQWPWGPVVRQVIYSLVSTLHLPARAFRIGKLCKNRKNHWGGCLRQRAKTRRRCAWSPTAIVK